MEMLFFEIFAGKLWRYKVNDYFIDADGFYIFDDATTGKHFEYHKSLYRGKSEVAD